MGFLSKIREGVLDFLFPKQCYGCCTPGSFVCEQCFAKLDAAVDIRTGTAGDAAIRTLGPAAFQLPFLDAVFPCLKPSPLLRTLIHAFKYEYCEELASVFQSFMVRRFMEGHLENFMIVPVPLHVRRLHDRGFNQSSLLAKNLSAHPVDLLVRHRFTHSQVSLSREERLVNLQDAFSVRDGVMPERVLLVDDVCTTGATLMECAKVLRSVGVAQVSAIVLARGVF
ncbi:MAG: phosphoribosyltransferase family protein [Patescibacteria group bacterium]